MMKRVNVFLNGKYLISASITPATKIKHIRSYLKSVVPTVDRYIINFYITPNQKLDVFNTFQYDNNTLESR